MDFTSIGSLLLEKRKSLGLSIQDVSLRTKISSKIIQRIESDDIAEGMNKTFLTAHVKNYAKVLRINEEEALNSLNSTIHSLLPDHTNKSLNQKLTESSLAQAQKSHGAIENNDMAWLKTILNWKVFVGLISITCLWFLFNTLNQQVQTVNDETEQINSAEIIKNDEIKPKEANLFELDHPKKMASELTTTPATDQKEEKEEKEKPKPVVKKKEEVKEKKPVEETKASTNDDKVVFPNKKFKKMRTSIYTLTDDPLVKDLNIYPSNFKSRRRADLQSNVYIYAKNGDTWLAHKSDDNKIKRYVLKQGQRIFLKGKIIRLFMGNINNAVIIYNDQLVTAQSSSGVKSFVFPQSQASEYFIPLFVTDKNGKIYTSREYIEIMRKKEQN